MNKCVVRRSKSDKNYGRLYYWNAEDKSFVSFIDAPEITEQMLHEWHDSLSPDLKEYWDTVYGDPLSVQKAKDTCALFGRLNTSTLQVQTEQASTQNRSYSAQKTPYPTYTPDVIAAPVQQTRSITLNQEDMETVYSEEIPFGFLNDVHVINASVQARSPAEYQFLYRNLIFYLHKNAATLPSDSIQSLFEELRTIESNKYIREMTKGLGFNT